MSKIQNNHRAVVPVFLLLIIVSSIIVYARSGGITGRTILSSSPGCTCHSATASGGVTVAIIGPDTVEVNQSAVYEVKISGGPLAAAGVNIAADKGVLNILNSALEKGGVELTHSSPLAPSAGFVTFSFSYTAPAEMGVATLAATGNSVNLGGSNSGDAWNHAPNKLVQIVLPASIPEDNISTPEYFTLEQNYPNPFNPQTTIRYMLIQPAVVQLYVYNMLGQKIAQLADGIHSVGIQAAIFNAEELESGSYVYRLTVNGQSQSRRMLLLK